MPYHLTTGARDSNRAGTFGTVAEAMASGMLKAATGAPFPAYIVEAQGMSGGLPVAGWDEVAGWILLEKDELAPEWWDKLDQRSRTWLLEHPRDALNSVVFHALTKAGAVVTSTHWVDSLDHSSAPLGAVLGSDIDHFRGCAKMVTANCDPPGVCRSCTPLSSESGCAASQHPAFTPHIPRYAMHCSARF